MNTNTAFDLLPCPAFCIDRSSLTLMGINAAGCEFFGSTREELVGKSLAVVCPVPDLRSLSEKLDTSAGGTPLVASLALQGYMAGRLTRAELRVANAIEAESAYWVIVARPLPTEGPLAADGGPIELGLPGHDPLTGLPDRRLFERRLDRAMDRREQHDDYQFAVCFLDLDGFKAVNDRLGHLAGDRVLCEVARRLVSCLRPGDMVARFGGDEFTIFVEDIEADIDARLVAHRILAEMEVPIALNGQRVEVGASIGIATSSSGCERLEEILHEADRAMYRAKMRGGMAIVFSPKAPAAAMAKPG